jgi:hypothetical protein
VKRGIAIFGASRRPDHSGFHAASPFAGARRAAPARTLSALRRRRSLACSSSRRAFDAVISESAEPT